MTITVKRQVEETVNVEFPFASKTIEGSYFIADKESVIRFNESIIVKFTDREYCFPEYVDKALRETIIPVDEAVKALHKILRSFKELQFSVLTIHE